MAVVATSPDQRITFRKDNDAKGLPASFCDAMLRTLTTGFRFFTCEAISGSDGRTGWFAAAFHAIAMRNRTTIVGFIVGNGSVGQSCLRHINLEAPKAYKIFHVMARNVEKNKKIVDDLQPTIDFPLKGSQSHPHRQVSRLPAAMFPSSPPTRSTMTPTSSRRVATTFLPNSKTGAQVRLAQAARRTRAHNQCLLP